MVLMVRLRLRLLSSGGGLSLVTAGWKSSLEVEDEGIDS